MVSAGEKRPVSWAGLKFFNVYGPNEYHKGGQKSVVCHLYEQIVATGRARLFRSHRPDYADGGQLRDFVWVGDCAEAMLWLWQSGESGLFNIGTGIWDEKYWLPVVVCIATILGLEYLYRRTLVGRAFVAIAEDNFAARALGLPERNLRIASYALAGAIERRLFEAEAPSALLVLAELDRLEQTLSSLSGSDAERQSVAQRLAELAAKWGARPAAADHDDLVQKLSSTDDDDELFRLIDQVRSE